MRKALVTGGAGFIGSHLCARLLDDGREVTAMDNLFTGSKKNIEPLLGDGRFSFVLHDVTEPFDGEFDEIYNLACPASPVHYQSNPVKTLRTSVLGMINALELARRTNARVLHTSTSEVYGDPLVHPQAENYWGNVNPVGVRSCYDEGKRCAETFAADSRREYGVDVRMVRIFNTYGPKMHPNDGRVVSNFITQALSGENLTLFGDGRQTRSFQYVDDLVEMIRRYMDLPRERVDGFFASKGMGTPVLNAGNPEEFTVRELAEEVLRLLPGTGSGTVFAPLPADDPKRRKPDISLAKELLGWQPAVPLAEGLAKTVEYFRSVSGRG
ncbi:MAG: SDR family oxidoreductase [Kiritimatiellae bacterium]|nr:SDR family oxidoreductase [Kiritimatiellia bacterium]